MRRLSVVMPALLIAVACGGGNGGSPAGPASGGSAPLVFKASVVEPSLVDFIVPLGNLNPPGHTLPTDHIYFYVGFLRPEIRGVPVFAPGDGTVQQIQRSGAPDVKLFVRVSDTFMYYVNHVVLEGDLREGARLTAGQRLGTSSLGGFGIDLGVMNFSRQLTFITPGRYPGDTLNADAPLKYYEEPLRGQLYALVRREGPEKDGRIEFDVPGRLSGNWFHETLSIGESAQPSGWSRHLAFVFDNLQPSEPRVSIGGWLGRTGVFAIGDGDPAFADVRPESGIVTYALLLGGGIGFPPGPPTGTLIVQMIDATRIRVEVTTAIGAAPAFTSAAQLYVR